MDEISRHEHWMRIALDEARKGVGRVEPNPPVGAVLVRDDEELARGHHHKFGGPHAEVEALTTATERGMDTAGATMYVTLEPCSHYGQTPPCVEAILKHDIARVVASLEDPDSRVAGEGFGQLREAGVEVVCGPCREEARELLKAYIKLRTKRRPWVIGKWAQTGDGALALTDDAGRWISNDASRRDVHRIRGLCDGILVGSGTAIADDPLLTNRSGDGKQPTRLVLDCRLRTPTDSRLALSAHQAPVLIATEETASATRLAHADALQRSGAELLALPCNDDGIDLDALLDELGRRQWTRLLVEGGAEVHRSFIQADLYDELIVYVSPNDAPADRGLPRLHYRDVAERLSLGEPEEIDLDGDRRLRWVLRS
ncbi:MAG: bifunctional diaminohydroxyphosphoribosylaminopyrimidine deaminase/5-amino-6-(5-phosphoribosylamino)uracil reductase RibD [Phycisphaerae bacterium]